ncbi:hypothetical protein [Streptomyces sp. HNM1019]|uniref:hypothetical protein n=1 Tax=Streptomyces sp. HNM1019 TaxID=3424717 RepID=UPI003D76BA6B
MPLAEPHAVAAVYALADRDLTRALLNRAQEETRELLSSSVPLSDTLVDEVIAAKDPELLRALASSRTGDTPGRADALLRLARLGDPALARALFGDASGPRPERLRLTVCEGAAATKDDPGWWAPEGLVRWLLGIEDMHLLLPALRSPFPELITHVLRVGGDKLKPRKHLAACRQVLAHGGPEALGELAEQPGVLCHTAAEAARWACASDDPESALLEVIRGGGQPRAVPTGQARQGGSSGGRPEEPDPADGGAPPRAAEDAVEHAAGGAAERAAGGAPEGASGSAPESDAEHAAGSAAEGAAESGAKGTTTSAIPLPPAPAPAPVAAAAETGTAPAPARSAVDVTLEVIGAIRERPHVVPELPAPGSGLLKWDALLLAHRQEPFSHTALSTLWRHPDCTEEMAVTAFREVRGRWSRDGDYRLYWSLLTAVDFSAGGSTPMGILLRPGVASGVFSAERVVREIGPARQVLNGLPTEEESVRVALAAQAARLGDDFAHWRALYTLVSRFAGTVVELVDTALAEAPRHRGKPWPKPLGPEFPYRSPVGGRAAFLTLFAHADVAARCALVEHLDGRTVQAMLQECPDPAVRDRLVEVHGPRALAGLAAHWHTPREVIEELVAYDDPEVNTALFKWTDLTDAERRRVLSGRRTRPNPEAGPGDRLPVTEELVLALRESARPNWLLPVVDSGDPVLCRVLLGSRRVKVHTPAQQLHMLTTLGERHGPEEVRALLDETSFPGRKPGGRHPLPAKTLEAAGAALDAADPLAALRELAERAQSPAGKAEYLEEATAASSDTSLAWAFDRWDEESGTSTPMPWAELRDLHGTRPLHDRLLPHLAGLDGCPPELQAAGKEANLRLSHSGYTVRRGKTPPSVAEMVRTLPLPSAWHHGESPWLREAYESGRVSLDEILHTAHPAPTVVAFLGNQTGPGRPVRQERFEETRRLDETLRGLAREHLGSDPEAWALVLRLLPEFEGTLPELLTAAGAVVS